MSRSSEALGALAGLAIWLAGSDAAAQPAAPCAEPNRACEPRPPPGTDLVPDLAVLKTPASPAAMVLGVVDGQIQRPTTPTGAAFSMAAGIAGQGEQKPLENFALDISPYWLFDHPRLTAGDIEATRPMSAIRNASLSIATAAHDEAPSAGEEGPSVSHRRLAVGLRTTLWPGRPARAALACQRFIDHVARSAVRDLATAHVQFNKEYEAENPRPVNPLGPRPDARARPWVQAAWQRAQDETRVLLAQWAARKAVALAEWEAAVQPQGDDPVLVACLDTVQQRTGFLIDAAGAYSLDFPDSDFGRLDEDGLRAATGWATFAYVLDGWVSEQSRRSFELSLLGMGRLQREWGAMRPDLWRVDGGGRIVLAWERYGISGEGVYRRQESSGDGAGEDLWRAALTFDYRLIGGTWVSATFGKDFGATADDQPVLALANLQWNLGRDRGVAIDRAGAVTE